MRKCKMIRKRHNTDRCTCQEKARRFEQAFEIWEQYKIDLTKAKAEKLKYDSHFFWEIEVL